MNKIIHVVNHFLQEWHVAMAMKMIGSTVRAIGSCINPLQGC